MSRRVVLAAGIALAAAGAVALGHERLRIDGTGKALYWKSPSAVSVTVSSAGSDDLPDGSHETALRMAIQDWNDVEGTNAALVEVTDPAQQARTDWQANDLHLVFFDEDGSSGYFGAGSGIVAITPVWFFSSGQIVDADVIFNGVDFSFTTSGQPGKFDVQDVGAHELGHLLGLDHSGWAGATMYPYVDTTVVLHRSLSEDEAHGLRDAYPLGGDGRIQGKVERAADGSAVSGAHVVARGTDGRTVASVLSKLDGTFAIRGLAGGTYTLYADPLDKPVSSANLVAGHVVHTDFETTYLDSPVTVAPGGTVDAGTLEVGADVVLDLGTNFDKLPLRAIAGSTTSHALHGVGLSPGSTLTASDPDLVVTPLLWLGTKVNFQVTVPPGEPPGHVDLEVVDETGARNVLPAALEVTPPAPVVSDVSPAVGSTSGGTSLTITGSGFLPGLRVVVGDQIYREGEPGGAVLVDSGTLSLSTAPTVAGTHDVVVLDQTGVEGRLASSYTAATVPAVDTLFPPAGNAAGGTEIVLRGEDFVEGLTVRISGVPQTSVFVDDETRVRVVTEGGIPGGPYSVEVENPGGGLATGAFAYVSKADPVVESTLPSTAPSSGGTVVTISGANFTADTTVVFGADPDTGLGGKPAASVEYLDASTLLVVTPAHASGAAAVLVQDSATGQAASLGGFAFTSSGGGGGGCSAERVDLPAGGQSGPSSAAWLLALLAATLLARSRAGRPRAAGGAIR